MVNFYNYFDPFNYTVLKALISFKDKQINNLEFY